MSQTVTPVPPPMTAAAADALVRGWPAEAKRLLLISLLRAGVSADDALPADWRTMKVVPPVLSPEEIADIRRAIATPDDTIDPEVLFRRMEREDRG